MPAARLPDSTLALATELRDLALALEPRLAELPAGTPVAKAVSGKRYWYLQSRGGGLEVQRFLGAETPELAARLERWRALAAELAPERAELERLCRMVVAGGVPAEPAAALRVLEILAGAGLFRAGAVLVGTRAFAAYASLLGLVAPAAARTQDLDVALEREVQVALPRDGEGDLARRLRETDPPRLAVPGLDPRDASTSFKLRGRELRVDFLTPKRPKDGERPVALRALGLAAWPVEGLAYLIEGALLAVVCGSRPVLVRVPDPSRFALHKLWLAGRRPAAEALRANKDLAQAEALLDLLAEDRPRDLAAAAAALPPRARAEVRKRAAKLGRQIE